MKSIYTTENSYPYPVFQDKFGVVEKNAKLIAAKIVETYGTKLDYQLVCTGTSGVIIAYEIAKVILPQMARGYDADVLYLKKEGENNHHGYGGSATPSRSKTMIVVDDFVSSGMTLRYISHVLRSQPSGFDYSNCVSCLCVHTTGELPEDELLELFPKLKHVIK